jgi:hypothetical protein
MSSTDFRQLSTKELHLYMNLVMGFCSDMRRLLSERNLTADAIDKYEMTTVNNLIAEVNYRSLAESEIRRDRGQGAGR